MTDRLKTLALYNHERQSDWLTMMMTRSYFCRRERGNLTVKINKYTAHFIHNKRISEI